MLTLKEAAQEFLAQKRIAVAGVSRQGDTAANAIYKKLRDSGYEVFPVNPNAAEVEGDRCYATLAHKCLRWFLQISGKEAKPRHSS